MLDEHVYYWAWQEKDNEDYDFNKPKWFRVFRATPNHVHNPVVTEADDERRGDSVLRAHRQTNRRT
jgi:hypothetical protein